MQAKGLRLVGFATLLLVGFALGATLARGSQGVAKPGKGTPAVTGPSFVIGKDGVLELRGARKGGRYLVLKAGKAAGDYPIKVVEVAKISGCDPTKEPMCEDCIPGRKGPVAACINPNPSPLCPPACLRVSDRLPLEVVGLVEVR